MCWCWQDCLSEFSNFPWYILTKQTRQKIFQFTAQLHIEQVTKMLKLSDEMNRLPGCSSRPLVHTCVSTAMKCGCVMGLLWMQSDVSAPRLNILPAWTHLISKVFHLTTELCTAILNQGHPCHVLTQAGIATFLSCKTCENYRSQLESWCYKNQQSGQMVNSTCTHALPYFFCCIVATKKW